MTLIELAIVIIVIAIISGVAASKLSSTSSITAGHQAELVANHIRQVQSLAISWGCKMKFNISATSYNVTANADYSTSAKSTTCGNGASVIKNPADRSTFTITLENGVQFAATGSLYFDILGRPTDAAGTPTSVTSSYTLSGDGVSYQISVSPVSGFVSLVRL